jgi:putative Mg2+ transporter-C (MgtC) family protein
VFGGGRFAAGDGLAIYGALAAALVIASNVVLRPLVRAINRQPVDSSEMEISYMISIVCHGRVAPQVRSLLVQELSEVPDVHFSELESANIEGAERVELTATVTSHKRREIALETIIGRLSKEDGVTRAGWRSQTQSV